ncbi:MAG: response regulator [Scytonematopsis contorta HA4267-MV1]|nr:response regulator [Scytonematopsis contorta HA4267-MV1]
MKILLIEDDNLLAQGISAVLNKQNCVVDVAADGEAGLELVSVCSYDLVVLDIMLPKLDGISLCRQLRQQGYQMPILLLTALDSGSDKVIGLDAGADDYVVKPFDFMVLLARIRALIRRGSSRLPPVLEWGLLHLDPSSCKVTYAEVELHLTAKEFSLLELFLRNNQRIFNRSTIVDQLWAADKEPPEEDTIKSHIKSLRRKLKAAGANYDFIETVYGMGYRLKPLYHNQSNEEIEPKENLEQQKTLFAAVQQLREGFQAKVGLRIAVIEKATNALKKGKLNPQLQEQAQQESHKLVGALGSFGFTEGSLLATEIENVFQRKDCIDNTQYLHLDKLLMELRRELENFSAKQIDDTIAPDSQCKNQLMIVSNDIELVKQLAQEATNQGIEAKNANNPDTAMSVISNSCPDVVLLDLSFCELPKEQTLSIPTLVITDKDNFADRLAVMRARGRGFLNKSMPAKQILELVIQVLQQNRITEAKVMVVSNDREVLTAIQEKLEPLELDVATVDDSHCFWEKLTKFSPNLLILDVEMADISGIELCQLVRNDPYWELLPVMFLVNDLEADIVEEIFTVGGDDCVSKSIIDSKLITRIFNRLKRIQKLRQELSMSK